MIKELYKESRDIGDQWGSAMGAFFNIAAELWWRGDDIPMHWEYSPGCTSDPREFESYFYPEMTAIPTSELLHFGNVMERYTRNLDRIGESY